MARVTAVQRLTKRIAKQEDVLDEIRARIAASVAWRKIHKPGDVDKSRTKEPEAPFWDYGHHGKAIGAGRGQLVRSMATLVKLHAELKKAKAE